MNNLQTSFDRDYGSGIAALIGAGIAEREERDRQQQERFAADLAQRDELAATIQLTVDAFRSERA